LTTGAWGDSVTIQNPSFEQIAPTNPLTSMCGPGCAYNAGNPMPGWIISGVSTINNGIASAGQFEPGSFFSLPLPDGNIVAYINSGSISQTLGVSVLPDSTYTLSVDVGRRTDIITGVNYSLNLLDGSNVLGTCTQSSSNASIAAGTFADITLTCTTGASVPAGLLGIELTGDGTQVNFDNVQLSVSTSTVSTPEPGALALTFVGLLMGGLLFAHSRRSRYLQSASS